MSTSKTNAHLLVYTFLQFNDGFVNGQFKFELNLISLKQLKDSDILLPFQNNVLKDFCCFIIDEVCTNICNFNFIKNWITKQIFIIFIYN